MDYTVSILVISIFFILVAFGTLWYSYYKEKKELKQFQATLDAILEKYQNKFKEENN